MQKGTRIRLIKNQSMSHLDIELGTLGTIIAVRDDAFLVKFDGHEWPNQLWLAEMEELDS